MTPFKPAEIRVILALSIMILLGSVLTLMKRQGKISNLDLGIFTEKRNYNYQYKVPFTDSTFASNPTAGTEDKQITEAVNPRLIDLNRAGYYDLQSLPGIGPATAKKIVALRDSIGRFESAEDLLSVSGIGPSKLAKIKDRIVIK